jgi:hypothetical protein
MRHAAKRTIGKLALRLAALTIAAYGVAIGVARWLAQDTTTRDAPGPRINAVVEGANALLPVASANRSPSIGGNEPESNPPNSKDAFHPLAEPVSSSIKAAASPELTAKAGVPSNSAQAARQRAKSQIPSLVSRRSGFFRPTRSTVDSIDKADPLKSLVIETELQASPQGSVIAIAATTNPGTADQAHSAPERR